MSYSLLGTTDSHDFKRCYRLTRGLTEILHGFAAFWAAVHVG